MAYQTQDFLTPEQENQFWADRAKKGYKYDAATDDYGTEAGNAARLQWQKDSMTANARANEGRDYISQADFAQKNAQKQQDQSVYSNRQHAMAAMQQKLGMLDKYTGGSSVASLVAAAPMMTMDTDNKRADMNRQVAMNSISNRVNDRNAQDEFNAKIIAQNFKKTSEMNDEQKALYDQAIAELTTEVFGKGNTMYKGLSTEQKNAILDALAKHKAGIISKAEKQQQIADAIYGSGLINITNALGGGGEVKGDKAEEDAILYFSSLG